MDKTVTGRTVTPADAYLLTSHIAESQHRLIILLLVQTGLTVHELACLKVDQIDLERKIITVNPSQTKSGRGRQVRFAEDVGTALVDHIITEKRKPSSFLLMTRQSSRMTERRIQQIVGTHTKKVFGESMHPRQLRESCIINAFRNNVPINEIEEMVGVDSIQPYIYRYFMRRQ